MKRSLMLNIFILITAVFFSSCNTESESVKNYCQIFSMDTVMELTAYGENSEKALNLAKAEINRIDYMLKRDNPNGEIYKINENSAANVSSETAGIISFALDISEKTGGVFDISIAPVMDLWGFYKKEYNVPSEEELYKALQNVGYKNIIVNDNTVSVKNNAKIDLGGIAKGFTSDKIIEIFKENNIASGIISLGGNVQALGLKPDNEKWKVGIQNPDDENSYIGTLLIENSAVITSGGYQRFFEKNGVSYHHIIDPSTGFPADSGIKSATVVCESGILADSLSTSLFIMGLEESVNFWRINHNFEFIIETNDDKIYITEGIKDTFESPMEYEIITFS